MYILTNNYVFGFTLNKNRFATCFLLDTCIFSVQDLSYEMTCWLLT